MRLLCFKSWDSCYEKEFAGEIGQKTVMHWLILFKDCSPHGAATAMPGAKDGVPRESLEVRLLAILP